jgi:hypothetical protein
MLRLRSGASFDMENRGHFSVSTKVSTNKVVDLSQTAQRSASEKMLSEAEAPFFKPDSTGTGLVASLGEALLRGAYKTVSGARSSMVQDELGRALSQTGSQRDDLVEALLGAALKRKQAGAAIAKTPINPALLGWYLASRGTDQRASR